MEPLPKLTRFIRIHSNLEPREPLKDKPYMNNYNNSFNEAISHDIADQWYELVELASSTSSPKKKNAVDNLHALRLCAKEVADVPRMIEEIAMFLFELFMEEDQVLVSHREILGRMYGMNAQQVNKVFSIVNGIVYFLDDDALCKIKNQIQLLKSSANSLHWCGILPYRPPNRWTPPDTSFLGDLVNDTVLTQENFSMTFNGSVQPAQTSAENKKAVYGKAWLLKEIERCCSKNFGITPAEITDSVTHLLTSAKSSDELQNELFDLLGFDNLELIQSLLEHRKDISMSHKLEMDKKSVSKTLGSDKKNELYVTQVTVSTTSEKLNEKVARKEGKKLAKFAAKEEIVQTNQNKFNPAELRAKRIASLSQPTPTIDAPVEKKSIYKVEVFPHVYDSVRQAQSTAGVVTGVKLMLPDDVKRVDNKQYESVNIPIPPRSNLEVGENLIPVSSLDKFGQLAFCGVQNLNRIQSVVFETAYNTNENLLICAPTGAGKTNIALLAMMHTIRQFVENDVIKRDLFKIVYVAPMKALASEMTDNFSKKLGCLNINVKELTGDMQLTKTEILQTQVLVTTPEKWDVVTRKSTGDVALSKLVKLLIIDEVHLLHGDRGPVIEALVARTLRQVETSQSMIRIVGLSATLPNYLDVARFLRVNPHHGLFYFDGRFRPVPLEQTFIGIKAVKPVQQMADMDAVCYEKAYELVSRGHQVMVFVHARNATNRLARCLMETARSKGQLNAFKPEDDVSRRSFVKDFDKSRSKELGEYFSCGFSIHHAGLLRWDRNLVEKAFSAGQIKLLVCTSTLAWGVNLPAHAVIIRGTEIYDAKHGSFIDLSILDVLQIFGRAGRPQFDTSGHGIIITTHNKLSHYLSLLTNQYPIESSFINFLADNLNAEISLGTISNVDEAVEWLSYTYLYVRMRINPQVYGLNYQDVEDDPLLETRRKELIDLSAKSLDKAKMIRYNVRTGDLAITDLGRTASHFYIKYDTVEVFNEKLKEIMNESEVLAMVSHAQEFQQLKVRDDEMEELEELAGLCEYEVPGGKENLHGKVNILMQAYLNKQRVKSFSLMSDLSYISQNAVRIIRALFEILLRQNNSLLAGRILQLALMMEHQLWPWQTPLRHFPILSYEILEKIENKDLSIETIRDMDSAEIGALIRHGKMGVTVKKCAYEFPLVELSASLHPITRTILRIKLSIIPDFKWNDKVHGKTSESYWVWIENPEDTSIYHSEYFLLTRKQVILKEAQELVMTVPLVDPIPPQYIIKVINDRWLGCSNELAIGVQNLILPESHPPHTELLDLQPLPLKALNNANFEKLYKFTHFNPIQTQLFHCLYHTDHNVLLGAPTGSGKTIMAEIAMFRVFNESPGSKVVYVAPLKALVRERIDDWKVRLENNLGKAVVELTGDVTPDIQAINNADVIVTTPEKWDGISRSWQTRGYVQKVALIVLDEVHLLGEDRGPVLEVIVSRTNFISTHTEKKLRIVALSTALANARDLANWLGIKQMGLYNFRPAVRPVPLRVHISGFPGKHYCPRMATMNRPVFQAICQHSPSQPALVFVSSRRQTRLTALDLIAYLAGETNPKQWLHLDESDMDAIISTIKDTNLRLTLSFGIGIHHAGLQERDRKTVEELFVNQKIQILIATATLAWGVNFPAHLVVVKGTEYFDGKSKRYVDMPITDVLQMMGRAGRPQFDNEGVAVILVHDVKKNFYRKFLYEPFPVESSLLEVLPDHLSAEIVAGTICTKQEALDYLTWTYFFRRLLKNPSYYDLETLDPKDMNAYLSKLVDKTLMTLYAAGCVMIDEDGRTLSTTSMGRIAAYYYLSHKTMLQLKEQMNSGLSLEKCMYTLCHVHEYSQVPVRHNEENYNGEIAKKCPWKVDQLQLDSPHIKTFLLLQAHFSRIELPSTDYYTDLKSVLDQSIRIIQGMLDVAGESGWLSLSLRLQNLMQMIMQGRWLTDSPFTSLPHVEHFMVTGLHRKPSLQTLPRAVHRANESYASLAPLFMPELDESQIIDVYNVLRSMPILRVTNALHGTWRGKQLSIPLLHDKIKSVEVEAGTEYTLSVTLERVNKFTEKRAYAPKFHKPKIEGWFLTLGDSYRNELMALRRVSFTQRRTTAPLSFYTPERLGPCALTLYIMSDTYLGLDQEYDIVLDVKANMSPQDVIES